MTEPTPELEIKSDADWKQKMKEESTQLDAQLAEETPAETHTAASASEEPLASDAGTTPEADTSEPTSAPRSNADFDTSHLPAADFETLVAMFSTQAMVALGVLPNPIDGKTEPNLPLAKHFIDLLGVLDEKSKRNLTGHEANLIQQSLHELRIAFVELTQPTSESPKSDG